MAAYCHYFKVVIPSQAKVIDRTMPEVMESEILNSSLFACSIERMLHILNWPAIQSEYPAVNIPWQ